MKIKDLPFIKFAGDGMTIESYWKVTPTTGWSVDNKTGEAYAVMLLAYMRDSKSTAIFSNVLRDVYRHGVTNMAQLHGVSVGFLAELARRAMGDGITVKGTDSLRVRAAKRKANKK